MIKNKITDYKDLDVWKKGVEIVELIYKNTKDFPDEEKFGLIAQMRRAAVSIPSNIAEGFRRRYNKEFKQFLHIALGSCAELETQIIISKKLEYINEEFKNTILTNTDHLGRMLTNFIKKL